MEDLATTFNEYILPHWPFVMVMFIFAVIGQFTSKSVFTRERAYRKSTGPWYKFWERQTFWWWGRETLPVHPIMTGGLLGLIWQNPEGSEPAWSLISSVVYFAGSGVSSLFVWAFLKGYLKQKGIDLELPGVDSLTPPPGSDE